MKTMGIKNFKVVIKSTKLNMYFRKRHNELREMEGNNLLWQTGELYSGAAPVRSSHSTTHHVNKAYPIQLAIHKTVRTPTDINLLTLS